MKRDESQRQDQRRSLHELEDPRFLEDATRPTLDGRLKLSSLGKHLLSSSQGRRYWSSKGSKLGSFLHRTGAERSGSEGVDHETSMVDMTMGLDQSSSSGVRRNSRRRSVTELEDGSKTAEERTRLGAAKLTPASDPSTTFVSIRRRSGASTGTGEFSSGLRAEKNPTKVPLALAPPTPPPTRKPRTMLQQGSDSTTEQCEKKKENYALQLVPVTHPPARRNHSFQTAGSGGDQMLKTLEKEVLSKRLSDASANHSDLQEVSSMHFIPHLPLETSDQNHTETHSSTHSVRSIRGEPLDQIQNESFHSRGPRRTSVTSLSSGGSTTFKEDESMELGSLRPGAYHASVPFEDISEVTQYPATGEEEESSLPESLKVDEAESSNGNEVAKRSRNRFVFLAVLAVIVLGASIGISVGVTMSKNSSSQQSSSGSVDVSDECAGSVRDQCNCGSEIVVMSDQTREYAERLREEIVPQIYTTFEEPIESCSMRNQALMHVASEGGIFYSELRVTRFLLTYAYLSWRGDKWDRNDRWLSSDSECSWYGLLCNENGAVTGVYLAENNLNGDLGNHIFHLNDTVEVMLEANPKLSGTVPTEIGTLSNLVRFSLETCLITGTIPTEIGELALLEYLNLESYLGYISGTIPTEVGRLTSLTRLQAGSTGIRGSIPSEIGSLTNMKSFAIWLSSLSGSVPAEMVSLSNLENLQLIENDLTGPLTGSFISNFQQLTALDVSENAFDTDDMLLPAIFNLTSLERIELKKLGIDGELDGLVLSKLADSLAALVLEGNNIAGSIPTEIGLMTNLSYLNVADNVLTGTIPSEVGLATNLVKVRLEGNLIGGTVPTEILNIPSLEELGVFSTQLSGTLDSGFCRLDRIGINRELLCPPCEEDDPLICVIEF